MSILVSTVSILLLLFPGLIFRYFLIQGRYQKIRISNIEQVYWAIIPALVLHLIVLWIIHGCKILPDVDMEILYGMQKGKLDFKKLDVAYSMQWASLYFITVVISGGLLGWLLRFISIRRSLHLVHRLFEVDVKWVRLFTEPYISKAFDLDPDKLFIGIDVLVEGSDNHYTIYSGTLDSFELNSNDNKKLESLTLIDVYRRNFNDDLSQDNTTEKQEDKNSDERWYEMPGHLFYINMDRVHNIHITYYEYSEVSKENLLNT